MIQDQIKQKYKFKVYSTYRTQIYFFLHFRFNPSSRNIKTRTRYTCVSPENGGSPGDVVQNVYRHEG